MQVAIASEHTPVGGFAPLPKGLYRPKLQQTGLGRSPKYLCNYVLIRQGRRVEIELREIIDLPSSLLQIQYNLTLVYLILLLVLQKLYRPGTLPGGLA